MPTRADAWHDLALLPEPTLTELFAEDPQRVDKLSGRIELGETGVLFDWSKTHLDDKLLDRFEDLAEAAGFAADAPSGCSPAKWSTRPRPRRRAHRAARRRQGRERRGSAGRCCDRMRLLVEAIHDGALGEVKHLIHVGIGGSALGPALAVDALARDLPLVDVHVVSNIDGAGA